MRAVQWTRLAAATALAASAVTTHAAPAWYSFSTTGAATGHADIAALLGSAPVLFGVFTYDPATAFTGGSGALGYEPGYAVYFGATSELGGLLGFQHFSDAIGSASVANPLPGTAADVVTLTFDPTPKAGANTTPADQPRGIAGDDVTIGDWRLDNVRLYWTGPADWLGSYALPAQLPTFKGRLALDFVRIDDPANAAGVPYYSQTVFFDAYAQLAPAVPEPSSAALAVLGLVAAGAAARRARHA